MEHTKGATLLSKMSQQVLEACGLSKPAAQPEPENPPKGMQLVKRKLLRITKRVAAKSTDLILILLAIVGWMVAIGAHIRLALRAKKEKPEAEINGQRFVCEKNRVIFKKKSG